MRNGLKNVTGIDSDTMKDATLKYHEEAGVPVVNKLETTTSEKMGAAVWIVGGILALILIFGVIVPLFV